MESLVIQSLFRYLRNAWETILKMWKTHGKPVERM